MKAYDWEIFCDLGRISLSVLRCKKTDWKYKTKPCARAHIHSTKFKTVSSNVYDKATVRSDMLSRNCIGENGP